MRPFKKLFGSKVISGVRQTMLMGVGRAAFSDRNYESLAREAYTMNTVAFRCIAEIAKGAASVNLQVCRQFRDGKFEILPMHPLLKLLERPGPCTGGAAFFESLFSYYKLAGNAYIYANSGLGTELTAPPREMQLLRPDKVKVITGPFGIPQAYTYKESPDTAEIVIPVDRLTGKSRILQIKTFNPVNQWLGMSPIEPAAYSVDIHNEIQKWNMSLFQNGAMPSGGLKTDDTLSEEQYSRLKEQIDNQMSGSRNAGKPLLMEAGLQWTPFSMSNRELESDKGIWTQARNICNALRVPPQIVGVPGDSTFANYEQARLALWEDTILPDLDMVLDELNHWLAPLYGDDVFIKYDTDSIPALAEKKRTIMDSLNNNTYMDINEKRVRAGLDEREGCDIILVNSNQIPLEDVGLADPTEPPLPDPVDDETPPEDDPKAKAYIDWLMDRKQISQDHAAFLYQSKKRGKK